MCASGFDEFFYGEEEGRGSPDPRLRALCVDLGAQLTVTTVEDSPPAEGWSAEVVVAWDHVGPGEGRVSCELAVSVQGCADRAAARDAAYAAMRETIDGVQGAWRTGDDAAG